VRVDLFVRLADAREAVAKKLGYYVINQEAPLEPELCDELDCEPDCSGRHEWVDIDWGPDGIFADLERHGVRIREEETSQ
jgi:hypothetical protein